MNGLTAYALSKKYVEESLKGAGALKGESGLSIKALSITQDDTGKILDATATLSDNSTIKVDIITSNTPGAERLEGDGAEYYTLAPTALSFRSDAPLNELHEVQINGVTVDPSNYTTEEGSTIVVFPIDYLKTLDTGDYEVTIASESKSVKGGFTVASPELNEHGFYYDQPYGASIHALNTEIIIVPRKNNIINVIDVLNNTTEICTYVIDGSTMIVSSPLGEIHCTVSSDGIYCEEFDATFVLGIAGIVSDGEYIYKPKGGQGGYLAWFVIDVTKTTYAPIRTGINGKPTTEADGALFSDNCTNLIINPEIPSTLTSMPEFHNLPNHTSVVIPDFVTYIVGFGGCTSLTNITFNGTVEQWSSITFGLNWNYNVPATHVQCSDGTVEL